MNLTTLLAGGVLALALMHVALYRIVRNRNLPDQLVLWGFSPLLIIPVLVYALFQKPRDTAVAPGTLAVSLLDRPALLFGVALLSLVPPMFVNFVVWLRYRALPGQLDADGFELRNGKRYRWADCEFAFSDTTGWLGLDFPGTRWVSIGPANRRAPETAYALRMLREHGVEMDARCIDLMTPQTQASKQLDRRIWLAALLACVGVLGAWLLAEQWFGEARVAQFAHAVGSLAFLGSAVFCAQQAFRLWQPGLRHWSLLLLILGIMQLLFALLFFGRAFLTA